MPKTAMTSAAIFYVATTGNDTNPGTPDAPFRTISKAASLMKPGDRCLIRAGIYRETVTPVADGLYFGPYRDEKVKISGCDVVSGPWSTYQGKILKTPMPQKVLQVFADGEHMNLARYPDAGIKPNLLSHQNWAKTTTSVVTAGVGKVVFRKMEEVPDDYWVGGYYSGRNGGNPFTAACGWITASAGDTLTIATVTKGWQLKEHPICAIGPGEGYIINCLHALTSPTEWYWDDKERTLYFYPPEGAATQNNVEARTRLWGLDLTGRSNIVVEKITFQAASLLLEDSQKCEIRYCEVTYPAPWGAYKLHDYGGKEDGSCGVFVSGSSNRIWRCHIAHSWGAGIRLEGSGNILDQCRIDDIDWLGRRMSAVQEFGLRNHVLRNVLQNCGASVIDGGQRLFDVGKWGRESDIRYNVVMSGGRLISHDSGLFYVNSQGDPALLKSVIGYNTFAHYFGRGRGNKVGHNAVYIDNGTRGLIVHDNVSALRFHLHAAKAVLMYNNGRGGKGNGAPSPTEEGIKQLLADDKPCPPLDAGAFYDKYGKGGQKSGAATDAAGGGSRTGGKDAGVVDRGESGPEDSQAPDMKDTLEPDQRR